MYLLFLGGPGSFQPWLTYVRSLVDGLQPQATAEVQDCGPRVDGCWSVNCCTPVYQSVCVCVCLSMRVLLVCVCVTETSERESKGKGGEFFTHHHTTTFSSGYMFWTLLAAIVLNSLILVAIEPILMIECFFVCPY